MPENHLTPEFLRQLFMGRASTQEVARVLLHTHKVCPTCREAVANFFDVSLSEQLDKPDDAALDDLMNRLELLGRQATATVRQAPELLAELEAMRDDLQRIAIETSKRFHSWPLGQLLLRRSRAASPMDPANGEHLASLALSISERLNSSRHSELVVNALKAQAWGCIGNARRISGDLQSADEALQIALLHHKNGGTDLLGEARLLEYRVSLLNSQRRLLDARKLAERVVEIYRSHDDPTRIARALILLGNVHRLQQSYEDAIHAYKDALVHIDEAGDPRLFLWTQHNLVGTLNQAGSHHEASELFQQITPLYDRSDDPWIGARRHWVEGQIASALGNNEKAITLLETVREQFLTQGRGIDAAIVSLELAAVYLDIGDTGRVRALAEQVLPIFHAQDVPKETMATLITFQRAVATDEVTAALVHKMSDTLKNQRQKIQRPPPSLPS